MSGLAATVVYAERCCVSATFVLSAIWKVRHHAEFRDAVGSVLGRFRLLRGLVQTVVPAVEVIVAVLLLVAGGAGRVGAALAGAVVVVFSATLLRSDLSAGCGCWSAPRVNRGALLIRNGILLALACTSLLGTPIAALRVTLAMIPLGILFAIVIMEIPSILQYFADAQGVPP